MASVFASENRDSAAWPLGLGLCAIAAAALLLADHSAAAASRPSFLAAAPVSAASVARSAPHFAQSTLHRAPSGVPSTAPAEPQAQRTSAALDPAALPFAAGAASAPQVQAAPASYWGAAFFSVLGATLGAMAISLLRTPTNEEYALMTTTGEKDGRFVPLPSDALIEACKANNMDKIKSEVKTLKGRLTSLSSETDVRNSWQVVYVDSLETLAAIGSGKQVEAGWRTEEAFLEIRKGRLEFKEVARRVGPYPNRLFNFSGTWKVKGATDLRISWSGFEEVNANKFLEGERSFTTKVAYVDARCLVLEVSSGVLVFEQKSLEDVEKQLKSFRVSDEPRGAATESASNSGGPNPFQALGNIFNKK